MSKVTLGQVATEVLNQHIFRVVPADIIDKMFLMTCFQGRLDAIIEKAHGGVGLRHITKADLEKIEFLLPPVQIQKQHALFVEKTDKSKNDSNMIPENAWIGGDLCA